MVADHSIKLLFDNAKISSYIFCICSTFTDYLNKDNLQECLKKNREHNLLPAACRARRAFFKGDFFYLVVPTQYDFATGHIRVWCLNPWGEKDFCLPLRNWKSAMMADVTVLLCWRFKKLWHQLHPFFPYIQPFGKNSSPSLKFYHRENLWAHWLPNTNSDQVAQFFAERILNKISLVQLQ